MAEAFGCGVSTRAGTKNVLILYLPDLPKSFSKPVFAYGIAIQGAEIKVSLEDMIMKRTAVLSFMHRMKR